MVALTTTVTAEEVRESLNNIAAGKLTDSLVEQKIAEGQAIVNEEKSNNCTQELFDFAVRNTAAWLTFDAWYIHGEMSGGSGLEEPEETSRKMEEKSLFWRGFCSRGTVAPGVPPTAHDASATGETQTILDWDGQEGYPNNALDLD